MSVTKHNPTIVFSITKSIEVSHGCHKIQFFCRFMGNPKILFPFFPNISESYKLVLFQSNAQSFVQQSEIKLVCKRQPQGIRITLSIFQNIFLD